MNIVRRNTPTAVSMHLLASRDTMVETNAPTESVTPTLLNLPSKAIVNITRFLSPSDRAVLRRVCKGASALPVAISPAESPEVTYTTLAEFKKFSFDWVILSDNGSLLEWARKNGNNCSKWGTPIEKLLFVAAVRHARLDSIMALEPHVKIFSPESESWDREDICELAAMSGDLPTFQYIFEKIKEPAEARTRVRIAAYYLGHINILEYVYSRQPDLIDAGIYNSAAEGEKLDVLKWLHQKNIKYSGDLVYWLIERKQWEILTWWRKNGYEVRVFQEFQARARGWTDE